MWPSTAVFLKLSATASTLDCTGASTSPPRRPTLTDVLETRSEIDRAVSYWNARGGVTLKDLDEAEAQGQARVQIYNNRVRPFSALSPCFGKRN
jgi:hypothetical protein